MRSTRTLLFLTGFAAIAMIAPSTGAQTFPATAGAWQVITRAQTPIAAAAGGNDYEDIVGDTTTAGAAAYVHSDATYLYFRIRINGTPANGGNTALRTDRVYGCEIDTDGDAPYELFALWDGINDKVALRQNAGAATDSPANLTTNELGFNAPGTWPTGTFGRVSAVGGDFFVDIAVARSAFPVSVPATKTLRFACGTGSVSALDLQVFSPNDGTLTNVWSDPYVCGNSGCLIDRDSDGVPDSVEAGFGTSPTVKDTDGDGIADNVELSATGSTGPYTAVDTDLDGTIDALDSDSDNDCRADNTDPSYRVKDANPSSVCTGDVTKPVCSSATGACAMCDGPNGGGTPAACSTASLPACNATGTCTQCNAATPGLCANPFPACVLSGGTAGNCAQCNGDKGDGVASAPCPTTGAPACQKSGGNFGKCLACSASNATLCTSAAAPACDTATGACSTCNGDFNGGTTKACPTSGAPVCLLGTGTCGTCTGNADCGAGHNGPTCQSGACVDIDSDGDGLFDSVEITLGTDPTKTDTDGDGITDNIEVTPSGGGPNQKIDTDNDGTIDALDTDSDGDTVLDSQEGTGDTDGDGAPDYRDPDDDGDKIPTKIEVEDGVASKVPQDVDSDGKKNWLDKDSNNNGTEDGDEGRGDQDQDGINDYLDLVKDIVKPDSGTSTSSSGGMTSSSSGFTSTEDDGGTTPKPVDPLEEGVVEGTGLFCGRAVGNGTSGDLGAFVLGALAVIGIARRRRR